MMQPTPALLAIAIPYVLLFGTSTLHGQTGMVVSGIDTTNFPFVSAKVHIVDSLRARDLAGLRLTENGVERRIARIDCPIPEPPRPISSVLTIDVSSSMQGPNLALAREAAHFWVDHLPRGLSRCAITSFSDRSLVNCDVTSDRAALHTAIDRLGAHGGTNYAAGLVDSLAGAIPLISRGSPKRVVVFLTDGQGVVDESAVVTAAQSADVTVYCVAIGLSMPAVLRAIAERTGGAWFERVDRVDRILDVYQAILSDAQGIEPCTIVWDSDMDCRRVRDVVLLDLERGDSTTTAYVAPVASMPTMHVSATGLDFGTLPAGAVATRNIDVAATVADITLEHLTTSHPSLSLVEALPLHVRRGEHRTLTVRAIGTGAPVLFGELLLEGSFCQPTRIYVRSTGAESPPVPLTLTHPNGGERFGLGDTVEFRWTGVLPETPVRLEVSVDAGRSWFLVADSAVGLAYRWHGSVSGDSCLARVVARGVGPLDSVVVLRGHISGLRDVAFSPDGSLVATGGIDESANIWNAADGTLLRSIGNHVRGIYSVDFSPDGRRLLVGAGNMAAFVWDLGNPTQPIVLQEGSTIPSAARYHPDGSIIATAAFTNDISFWNASDGSLIESVAAHADRSFALAFSRDGDWLASGSYDNTAVLWAIPSRRPHVRLQGHRGAVNAVAFAPDGETVATGSADGTVRFWSLPDGESLRTWEIGSAVGALLFHSDGNTLIIGGSDGVVRFCDVATGTVTRALYGHDYDVTALALSPDGRELASASFDNTARIWDLDGGAAAVDVSDGPWSILAPAVDVLPVDFGEVHLGSFADTTIGAWLCNRGPLPVRVDTVSIVGGDSTDFGVVRIDVPRAIRAGECIPVELGFRPTRPGRLQCTIRASGGDWSVQGTVSGIGRNVELEVADPIDFGRVLVGSSASQWCALRRRVLSSAVPRVAAIVFDDSPANEFTWSHDRPAPFEVVDSVTAAIAFAPMSPGRRVGLVTLYDSVGRRLGWTRVTGEGYCNDDAAQVSIANTASSPGSIVRLPVLYSGPLPQQPTGFVVRLRFHRSLVYPIAANAAYTRGADRIVEYHGEWDGASDTLTTIPLMIALGDTTSGSIDIEAFAWTSDCAPQFSLLGGSLDLSDLCGNGTNRLVRNVGAAEIISVIPNALTTTARVEYRLSEQGVTRLECFDLAGKLVLTLFSGIGRPGFHTATIVRDRIASGTYFLRLTTPTDVHERRVVVR